MDAEVPILNGDLANRVRSGVRWNNGQRSIMGCILRISRGTIFWPIRRAWRTTPAILHAAPMGRHDRGPPS